ncbi:SDR family oxidoreductase [Paractinoplanes atraurantiacus]|uniref:Short-chain dehydrogenase n=1 Tax=Paractinoplanes atraurantiacus TaxID=1036182 RepID=A0A285F7A4_9ACTN|nr:SDR family oxidoreductase [Actinoplanes atraurantiacus]SNY06584.1 Short-chain dehydrogenase [Actinoplanes atraurantiacus]
MTAIKDSVALVTGGSRGIGKALVEELYARGASKVYATARDPRSVSHPDAVPLALEVTDEASVAAAAARATDVTILINNAGLTSGASFLDSPLDEVRRDMEANFYGPLLLARAFVPVIEHNGGGHILNVHSALSWLADGGPYSASKAALWSQSNSLRLLLRSRHIEVTGLHVGYVDTDMTTNIDAPKTAPRDVATAALDGIESNTYEVLVDEVSRNVKSALAGDLTLLYTQLAA